MPKFYIGTAGWSYKDWVPSFYPKNQSGRFDWLQFYSHNFIFDVKLHQDFTHKRNLNEQNIKAVRYNLDILSKAERLGGLLIQFPYSFVFDDSSIKYLQRIRDTFPNYSCFVEVRHSSWKNKKAMDFFKEANLTFCTIDQPQIGQAIPFEPIITNDKAYIRFHGRNEEAWKKSINQFGKKQTYEEQSERYKYLYSPGELIEIEQKIKSVQEKVKEVHVIMNNHPQGDAVANAFELIHLLEQKDKVEMPPTIVKVYPRLQNLYTN